MKHSIELLNACPHKVYIVQQKIFEHRKPLHKFSHQTKLGWGLAWCISTKGLYRFELIISHRESIKLNIRYSRGLRLDIHAFIKIENSWHSQTINC
uniref:Uncharacterized protein n=1 Tax=Arundo donax TaxID=35708 RepID=A0A0A9DDJ8_ARUDO